MLKLFQISLLLILFTLSSPELFAQQTTDTSRVLVRFNEPMSRDGIFNPDNYTIFRDDSTPIAIYKVGVVPGDTAVVLYTEKHIPQSSYKIIVNNLRDKTGNMISENHKIAFY
ncbi:MAG: Ig-like domain-containing protein [Ignavibacteriota bacterium]